MPRTSKQCEEIRAEMKNKILRESILYFARNGFAGTKISDLAKHIGIGQGTLYVYFKSKEELFEEIHHMVGIEKDIKDMRLLSLLPINGKKKINRLSQSVIKKLGEDELFAAKIALNSQIMLEVGKDYSSIDTTYESELYKYMSKIIEQGQKEGSIIDGNPLKLADYYWSVVYVYALKKLFTTQYEMINGQDLDRIILKETI